MQVWEAVKSALVALSANRLRSLLTVLGTVVGVVSVVSVVAITQGLNRYVSQEMLSLGSHTFTIDKFGMITSEEGWYEALRRKDIRRDHVEYLEERMTTAGAIVPSVGTQLDLEWRGQEAEDVQVTGLAGDYPALSDDYDLASGRHLTLEEGRGGGRVTVVGADIAEELFGAVDPVGQQVRIGGETFWVVGTLVARGKVLGQSRDNVTLIPLATFQTLFGRGRSLSVSIRAASPAVYETAQEEAELFMKIARGLQPWDDPDFGLQTAETYYHFYRQTTGLFYIGMIGIVGLSLVVGGIVMMNIMLVAVTERTREIGIRKAVGARRRDILMQFLVEAMVLAFGGGFLGVVIGGAIAMAVDTFSPLPARVEAWSVVVSLLLAVAVGLGAGLYPASRAASLSPVRALSYEK